jgi:hypothetical protein
MTESENNNVQGRPILDTYSTTARKLKKDFKSAVWCLTEEEKRIRKFNRAYQRFMLGSSMPGEYRLLTLTTPPEFKGDLHGAWRKFVMRMRRRGLMGEYYAVKEWNKAHTCQHLHVALRLGYIGYQVALQQWKAITGAVWIHVDKVTSARGMASYLGKYLNKAYDDEPGKRSYWYAYGWIYRKWRAFSKEMFKLGNPVLQPEHEYIHNLNTFEEKVYYMNGRLIEAVIRAIKTGLVVNELKQF